MPEKIKPFFETSVGFGGGKEKTEFDGFDETENKFSTFNFNLGGGVSIFLHEILSLDLGLNYNYNRGEFDNSNDFKSNGINFITGFSFFL